MDMAQRLQDLRKKSNYSQEQVSDMLGISRQAISKWESGQGKPEIDNIIKLVEIYNVSADYILLGEEKNTVVEEKSKKSLNHTSRKTIEAIAIIVASAIVALLFIVGLGLLAKYVL